MYEIVYGILITACSLIILAYGIYLFISIIKQQKELNKLTIEELKLELQKTTNKMRIKIINKILKQKQK